MSNSISVVAEPPTELKGMKLKVEVVDPEVLRFEEWYAKPENAGSSLLPMERDILALYLHAKLSEKL
jgi:hypothetical protein